MISILAKLFIHDSKNFSDVKVRQQYGILCGGVGIFLNCLLFICKLIFGTIAASVSMIADAFNNLSDAASSLIEILGFKLSLKKPDSEHPFGHGRLEYVSGLIISFLVLLMGFELGKKSVETLIHPQKVEGGIVPILIMCGAILVKFYMYIYNHRYGKKLDSVTMVAAAKDSLGDMLSNLVVIASIILSKYTSLPVDGAGGIIVAFLIIKTGLDSAKDTIEPLLGAAPSAEFISQIEKEVLAHKPISGVHDIVVHDYGPGRVMVSLHAEVPGDMDVFEMHGIIDKTETDISKKFNCQVVIHSDPIDIHNKRLVELKSILKEEVQKINQNLMVHDIRMVPGKNVSNLIFDVVKPFDCPLSDEELKNQIKAAMKVCASDINCVITVDIPLV